MATRTWVRRIMEYNDEIKDNNNKENKDTADNKDNTDKEQGRQDKVR